MRIAYGHSVGPGLKVIGQSTQSPRLRFGFSDQAHWGHPYADIAMAMTSA